MVSTSVRSCTEYKQSKKATNPFRPSHENPALMTTQISLCRTEVLRKSPKIEEKKTAVGILHF